MKSVHSDKSAALFCRPLIVLLSLFGALQTASAQTTSFNFQGRLNDGAVAANGHYDLRFRLFSQVAGGFPVGEVLEQPDVPLVNGVFSTVLDFGESSFPGDSRWIEISLRPTGSTNEYVVLGGRQRVRSVPYAIRSRRADNADTAELAVVAQNANALGTTPASDFARISFLNPGNFSTAGRLGVGTASPNTHLTLAGGVPWTSNQWSAPMNMQNASAFGWEANSSGQRFGIGQTNGGLHIFRTTSGFGSTLTPSEVDVRVSDNGNLMQPRERHGLAKAMVFVDPSLPAEQYIVRCYNGVTDSSAGNCGFTIERLGVGLYSLNLGFQVSDRFLSVTAAHPDRAVMAETSGQAGVRVYMRRLLVDPGHEADASFYLIVF